MKHESKILFIFLLIVSVFYFYQYVKSYDTATHSSLTSEIVDFYNLSFEKKLNNQQKELIIRGSVDEDSPATRVINHFYDPVRNIGLLDGHSAKNWAISDSLQKYSLVGGGDYSWPRIFKDYAEGNEERAFLGLGHVLHLIEDMAVPDHTRNDSHLKIDILGFVIDLNTNPSPYEEWAKEKTVETISNLEKPKSFSNLGEYFDFMASYSNNNFFSKDTIFGDKYSNYNYENPKIVEFDENYGYGIDSLSGEKNKLLIAIKKKDGRELMLETKDDISVLQEYFSRLSKQAILSGAGVVDLFFKEAEAARQEYLKQQKIKQEQGAQKNLELSNYLNSANVFQLVGFGFKTAFVEPVVNPVVNGTQRFARGFNKGATMASQGVSNLGQMSYFAAGILKDQGKVFVEEKVQETKENIQQFVGSGITFVQKSISGSSTSREEVEPSAPIPTEIVSLQSVSAAPIVVSEPQNIQSEVGPPKVEIAPLGDRVSKLEASKLAEEAPWWKQLGYNHPGELPGQAVNPDLTAPTVSLEIKNYSLVSRNLDIGWTSPDTDINFYNLEFQKNGGVWQELLSKTKDIILNFTADDNSLYKFRIKAVDFVGNESNWFETTNSFEINTKPIVINEIAWMGTQANSADEWIELYNTSNQDIDLTGWSLVSPDESPNIVLGGVIKAKSYFLLERTDDKPTSESADWFFTGALNNRNDNQTEEERKLKEGLTLRNGNTIIDKVSLWYAGYNQNNLKLSMERISPLRDSDDPDNWKNNDMFACYYNLTEKVSIDIGGNKICGTPKYKNSLINNIGGTYSRNINFYAYPEVVYLVDHFILNTGSTLTIEPGTVIKFQINCSCPLIIEGKLLAVGEDNKKIYFTSFKDDSVGGDSNGDSNATLPVPEDWERIYFKNSVGSILENVEVRYGGRIYSTCCVTYYYPSIYIENSDTVINKAILDQSNYAGIGIYGSSNPKITNSEIKNIKNLIQCCGFIAGQPWAGYGIFFENDWKKAGGEISNNYFENNLYGIYAYSRAFDSQVLKITNNTFKNISNSIILDFSGLIQNFGNKNLDNKATIRISGTISTGQLRTLFKDDIPYSVFNNLTVQKGATLIIEPGTILRFAAEGYYWSSLIIEGVLKTLGAIDKKIYFTSYSDNGIDSPGPGSWRSVYFKNAQDSEISNAVIKYGGSIESTSGGFTYYYGGIEIDGDNNDLSGTVKISDTEIDNNFYAGIIVKNKGKLDLVRSSIKNTQHLIRCCGFTQGQPWAGYGILLDGWVYGSATLSDSTIQNNNIGLSYPNNSPPNLFNVTFEGNTKNEETR